MKESEFAKQLERVVVIADRHIIAARNGGCLPTVSAVARDAGLSRQTLYETYPAVVAKLRSARAGGVTRADSTPSKLLLLRRRLAAESEKVKVLSAALVEALAELSFTKTAMQDEIDRLERRVLSLEALPARVIKRPVKKGCT